MSERNKAFNDVLGYLEYRIAVCRVGLEEYEASHGPTSRAAATERSALFEAELIHREIAELALIQRRSKRFRVLAEERAAYLAAQTASHSRQGEKP
jgi:hypothetical protein